jgi:hypothetical protein
MKLLNFIFVIYKCLLFMCFDCLCVLMSIVSRFNSIYLGSRRPFKRPCCPSQSDKAVKARTARTPAHPISSGL